MEFLRPSAHTSYPRPFERALWGILLQFAFSTFLVCIDIFLLPIQGPTYSQCSTSACSTYVTNHQKLPIHVAIHVTILNSLLGKTKKTNWSMDLAHLIFGYRISFLSLDFVRLIFFCWKIQFFFKFFFAFFLFSTQPDQPITFFLLLVLIGF